MKNLQIKKVTNEHGVNVYHVEDEGCIQEFNTIKEANEYVRYVNKVAQEQFTEKLKDHLEKKTGVSKKWIDSKVEFIF